MNFLAVLILMTLLVAAFVIAVRHFLPELYAAWAKEIRSALASGLSALASKVMPK